MIDEVHLQGNLIALAGKEVVFIEIFEGQVLMCKRAQRPRANALEDSAKIVTLVHTHPHHLGIGEGTDEVLRSCAPVGAGRADKKIVLVGETAKS